MRWRVHAGDGARVAATRAPVRMRSLATVVTAVLLVLGLGACGASDHHAASTGRSSTTTPRPTASAPEATAPPTDAGGPRSGRAPMGPGGGGSRGGRSGGGKGSGEQPIRVPATFEISGGRLLPYTISVPAFLAVQVTVASRDGRAHVLTLQTSPPRRLSVPAGGRASLRIPGLRAGNYRLVPASGGSGGVLAVGGDAGP